MKYKQYHIDTLEKLLNVINEENFDRFCIDLVQWLGVYTEHISKIRKENPEVKDWKNSEILGSSFIWIDDKKNDLKFIRIENPKTGEIYEKKFKE